MWISEFLIKDAIRAISLAVIILCYHFYNIIIMGVEIFGDEGI